MLQAACDAQRATIARLHNSLANLFCAGGCHDGRGLQYSPMRLAESNSQIFGQSVSLPAPMHRTACFMQLTPPPADSTFQ